MRRLLPAVLLVLSVTSCASVQLAGAGLPAPLAPKPKDCQVRLFRLGPPAVPFEEVGSALVTGSVFLSPQSVADELRREACKIGADAVILRKENYGIPFYGSAADAVFIRFLSQDRAASGASNG